MIKSCYNLFPDRAQQPLKVISNDKKIMFGKIKLIAVGLLLLLSEPQLVNAEELTKYAVLSAGSSRELACYQITSSGNNESVEHELGCDKTLKYLESQCSVGDTQSCLGLAGIYRYGLAGQSDKGVDRQLLIEVCEQGSASTCRVVWNDDVSADRHLLALNKSKATESFIRNCDELGGDACAELAMAYAYGLGFDQNMELSERLLDTWCESGSNKACHLMVGLKVSRYIPGLYEEELIEKISDHCDYNAYAPCARHLMRLFTSVPVVTADEMNQSLNENIISTEFGQLLSTKKYSDLIVYMDQQEKDDFKITQHIQSMNSRAAHIANFGGLLDEFVQQQPKSRWAYLLRASYRFGESLDVGKPSFGAAFRRNLIDSKESRLIESDIDMALTLKPKSPLSNFLAAQVALSQRNWVEFANLMKRNKKSAKQHYWYWQLRFSKVEKSQSTKLRKAFLKAEKRNSNLKKLTHSALLFVTRGFYVTTTRVAVDDAWYKASVEEYFNTANWHPACDVAKTHLALFPLSRAAIEANIRCDKYLDKVLAFSFKKQPPRPSSRLTGRTKNGVFLAKCKLDLGVTRLQNPFFFGSNSGFQACAHPSYEFSVKPEFYDWRLRKLLRDLKIDSRINARSLPPKHTVKEALYGISPDLTRIGFSIIVEVDDKYKRQLEIKWVGTLDDDVISSFSEPFANYEVLLSQFETGIDIFTTALVNIDNDSFKNTKSVEVEQLSYTDQILLASSIGKFVVNEIEYIVAKKNQDIKIGADRKPRLNSLVLIQQNNHSASYAQQIQSIKALKPTLLKREKLTNPDEERTKKNTEGRRKSAEYLGRFGREQQQRNNQIIRDRLFKNIKKH